jgi:hypothetical protein
VDGDHPTLRSIGGFSAVRGEFSISIGTDPKGRSGSTEGAISSRQHPPISVVRACALFAADLCGIIVAATVAFFLHVGARLPPLIRVLEQADRYDFHWSGWRTLAATVLIAVYFKMIGHKTVHLPFWLDPQPVASQLLETMQLQNLMAQIQEEYNLVVVDGHPMTHAMRSATLANIVDAVVLVIAAGETSCEQVRAAVVAITTAARGSAVVAIRQAA